MTSHYSYPFHCFIDTAKQKTINETYNIANHLSLNLSRKTIEITLPKRMYNSGGTVGVVGVSLSSHSFLLAGL